MDITIQDIIDKRKKRWEERHDIEFDKVLVRASVVKILQTPSPRRDCCETVSLDTYCVLHSRQEKKHRSVLLQRGSRGLHREVGDARNE